MLLSEIESLLGDCREAFGQERGWERGRRLLLSHLVTLSRHTVTGLITASGRQWDDWSADYRLLSKERFNPDRVFAVVRRGVVEGLARQAPLVVAMDDTATRKDGRKIPGTGWRRDPLGPAFRTNFIWGRRFLQLSAIVPAGREDAPSRAIPIGLHHAPSVKKPSRNAPDEVWVAYREESRRRSLGRQAIERLAALREQIDEDGERDRPLWVCADGGYTNRTVLRNLPRHTAMIGRIRSDAVLHPPPTPNPAPVRGRRRRYGTEVITPEGVRQDDAIPWQTARVYAAGKPHDLRFKTVASLLWRAAGPDIPMRLIIIAPLAYRRSKASKLLYRNPAYLVCTGLEISPEEVLKAYVSRWDIEVNFRDEKQLFGLDEAQVRTEPSARLAPALAASAYAILLLGGVRAFGTNGLPQVLPAPKWRQRNTPPRASTAMLMNHLRFEMWSCAIATANFSHFAARPLPASKHEKSLPSLPSTIFYARPAA